MSPVTVVVPPVTLLPLAVAILMPVTVVVRHVAVLPLAIVVPPIAIVVPRPRVARRLVARRRLRAVRCRRRAASSYRPLPY